MFLTWHYNIIFYSGVSCFPVVLQTIHPPTFPCCWFLLTRHKQKILNFPSYLNCLFLHLLHNQYFFRQNFYTTVYIHKIYLTAGKHNDYYVFHSILDRRSCKNVVYTRFMLYALVCYCTVHNSNKDSTSYYVLFDKPKVTAKFRYFLAAPIYDKDIRNATTTATVHF